MNRKKIVRLYATLHIGPYLRIWIVVGVAFVQFSAVCLENFAHKLNALTFYAVHGVAAAVTTCFLLDYYCSTQLRKLNINIVQILCIKKTHRVFKTLLLILVPANREPIPGNYMVYKK